MWADGYPGPARARRRRKGWFSRSPLCRQSQPTISAPVEAFSIQSFISLITSGNISTSNIYAKGTLVGNHLLVNFPVVRLLSLERETSRNLSPLPKSWSISPPSSVYKTFHARPDASSRVNGNIRIRFYSRDFITAGFKRNPMEATVIPYLPEDRRKRK